MVFKGGAKRDPEDKLRDRSDKSRVDVTLKTLHKVTIKNIIEKAMRGPVRNGKKLRMLKKNILPNR